MPTDPENTITSIAKLLGVSRTTLYEYLPAPSNLLRRPMFERWSPSGPAAGPDRRLRHVEP
ncbi:helix-turn-helix domain-containing protein [Streptomyces sp. NPDC058686]|uniref:helix-turn-helix domain-containing protein n=1 Tax=Streptomyces sp. NPDC058686 TaxID=3346599 RepID=UPI0036598D8F